MNEEGYETAARLSARVAPAKLGGLIALVERGTISGSTAKEVFDKMFASGRTADEIVSAEGLTQIDDESDLSRIIAEVLAQHADAVAMYQGGKATTFGYLVGQVMKAAAGKANPRRVNELLRKALGAAGAGQQ
jgi:aspartyl-tRNA(Asn)/glutamyl-tRNA(Gln) amidotransferase subunit B